MKETNIKTKCRTIDLRERLRYHKVYFVITLNVHNQQFRNLNCVKNNFNLKSENEQGTRFNDVIAHEIKITTSLKYGFNTDFLPIKVEG